MTRYFLTRIKIEGFRGINNESDPLELRFRPDAVNSVFAINAAGKSSIFEALCYAIRGMIPKLDALQAQERPEDYVCNRFHSKGTATIEIELQPDDVTSSPVTVRVERDVLGGRVVTSPSGHADPEYLLDSLNEEFTLLDYATFSRFIDSSPLERGRSFSALLGLSRYSDFRQTLQAASETRALGSDLELTILRTEVAATQEAAQRELRQLTASYAGMTGKQLTDVADIDRYAADVLAALAGIALIKESVDGKTLEKVDFAAVRDQIRAAEGGDNRRHLEMLIAKLADLQILGDPDATTFQAEQTELRRLISEQSDLLNATRGDLFRKLYEAAKRLIDIGKWQQPEQCPLCESALQVQISGLVSSQLDQYSYVSAKAEEVKAACRSAAWIRRLMLLERTKHIEVADDERHSGRLTRSADNGELTLAQVDAAIDALSRLEAKRAIEQTAANATKEEIEKTLPPSLVTLTEQVEYGRQFREALEAYRNKDATHAAAFAKLELRDRWRAFITRAAATFAIAEADLSQRKITAIDTEYKAMFARVTGVNDVTPNLQRADRREDLYVQLSDFHGLSDVSARALLSESYRNALAISVFLSAALKHAGIPRFVVLDDVTSSFDSGHQWNLMEVIRQKLQHPGNPDGLQFIVLSHDGLLEKYFDKLGNTLDWHHQKLQGWPPLGAVLSQTQDANRLRSTATRLLDAGQVKEAEPLIRQYLEFKLLQIINKVRVPVPLDFAIKDHLKMVSNCLDAIGAAIELHKLAGKLILDANQVKDIDTAHVPVLVSNWMSHYETASGSSLSPPVLKGILTTIDEFAECFRYDDTATTPVERRWYRSLSDR